MLFLTRGGTMRLKKIWTLGLGRQLRGAVKEGATRGNGE